VAVVFSLSGCGGGGDGEGETDTVLVYRSLTNSSVMYLRGTPVATTPGAAAAAVQALKQNGIAVLNYWCAPVELTGDSAEFFNPQIMVVASVTVTDAAKIKRKQNPDPPVDYDGPVVPVSAYDPLYMYYVYDPTIFNFGKRFDCESNGW